MPYNSDDFDLYEQDPREVYADDNPQDLCGDKIQRDKRRKAVPK